jgi:hypothetical protein
LSSHPIWCCSIWFLLLKISGFKIVALVSAVAVAQLLLHCCCPTVAVALSLLPCIFCTVAIDVALSLSSYPCRIVALLPLHCCVVAVAPLSIPRCCHHCLCLYCAVAVAISTTLPLPLSLPLSLSLSLLHCRSLSVTAVAVALLHCPHRAVALSLLHRSLYRAVAITVAASTALSLSLPRR